jgi:penicillin-binding protein 1A
VERESRRGAKRENRKQRRGRGRGIFFGLFTLMLIGVCTAVMIGFIFMKYVDTTLAPTLQIDADDYTMAESSIIYYHDDEVTENDGWVEYQMIHGTENRVWVDFEQMPDALWQAAVAIAPQRSAWATF